jgi:galactonate dehydratase
VLQEMSWGIHYNTGGFDLDTYLADRSVFAVKDGMVAVPEGPGLGVALDLDKVMDAAREGHRWRNPLWRRPDGSFAEW